MVVQDPLDGVPGDVVAEVGERAADPRVAPRRILTCSTIPPGCSKTNLRKKLGEKPISVIPSNRPAVAVKNRWCMFLRTDPCSFRLCTKGAKNRILAEEAIPVDRSTRRKRP